MKTKEATSAAAKAKEEKQMEAAVSAAKEAIPAVKKEAEVEKSGEAVALTCQMANRPARRREVGWKEATKIEHIVKNKVDEVKQKIGQTISKL